jgi:hypothetical protein
MSFPRSQLNAAFVSYQPSLQEAARAKDRKDTLRAISSDDAHIDSRRLDAAQSNARIMDLAKLVCMERVQHETAMQQVQRSQRDQLDKLGATLAKTALSTFDIQLSPSTSVDEKLDTFLSAVQTRAASMHEQLEKSNSCLNSIRSALNDASTPPSNEQRDAPLDKRVRELVECLTRAESSLTTGSTQFSVTLDSSSFETKLAAFMKIAVERSSDRDQLIEELKSFIDKAFQAGELQKPSFEGFDSTSSRDAIRDWLESCSAKFSEGMKMRLRNRQMASSSTFHGEQTLAITSRGSTLAGIAPAENDAPEQSCFIETIASLDESFSGVPAHPRLNVSPVAPLRHRRPKSLRELS